MPPTLLLVLPTSVVIAALLLRRSPGPWPLAATALLAQLAWHCLWLSLSASDAGPGTAPGGGEHAVHGGSAPAMLVAHLLVALICTALACGLERALLRLVARRADDVLARVALAWTRRAVPVPVWRSTTVDASGPRGSRGPRRRTQYDRGPPAARFVLAAPC